MEAKAYINKGTEGHYEVLEMVLVYPNYYIHSITHRRGEIVEQTQIKTIKRTPERPNIAIHENMQPVELQEGEELFVQNAANKMIEAYESRPGALKHCNTCDEIKPAKFFEIVHPNSSGVCKECYSSYSDSLKALASNVYCSVCYHAEALNENNTCANCSNLPY